MSSLKPQPCPQCANLSDTFVVIDSGMRVALQEGGVSASLPDRVCSSCYEALSGSVNQGLRLRMEQVMREKNKMMAWKSRVNLIKNARALMNQKAYSEAAVQYEKYLRVLEVVYNLKKGELTPAVFNNSSRSKELTIIASVYWDLVRIYDTSPRYGDRMQKAAIKLADFLQFSPMFPDTMKKAEAFARTCKNQAVMKTFLRATRAKRGPCFIATAAFADSPDAMELLLLRRFRDQRLRRHAFGRQMIFVYYKISPPIGRALAHSPRLRRLVRQSLTRLSGWL